MRLTAFIGMFAAALACAGPVAVTYSPTLLPLRLDRESHVVGKLTLVAEGTLTGFTFATDGALGLVSVEAGKETVATVDVPRGHVRLPVEIALTGRKQEFAVRCQIASDMLLTSRARIDLVSVEIAGKSHAVEHTSSYLRPAVRVRDAGDEGAKGHRIPALVRSKAGTLIAAYDVRYTGRRDLQGHMDIGLNRSSDNGQTWSSRIIALDMGTYGGLPEAYNGVSDAALLVDEKTGRIFCFGLWMHGVNDAEGNWQGAKGWRHQWNKNGSMQGFEVKGTSQFLMSFSDDDGLTWSMPRNLTRMVKRNPEWFLYAPAPGNGITLKDGTLVVPTQGRNQHRGEFSTIMISKDRGETWHTGMPANDTTAGQFANECAVVELSDGALMLNARDPSRKKSRGVFITRDRGETWEMHPTDHKALIEPTCMASLIRHETGDGSALLLFANPNSKTSRSRMTIKASRDEGMTWPPAHQLLLDQKGGAYSSLTSIGTDSVGILYESSQAELLFQRVQIAEILGN
ncbi:MAG: sialidase-1 [Rhodothermales bacterium]|jgi:sialidase-1